MRNPSGRTQDGDAISPIVLFSGPHRLPIARHERANAARQHVPILRLDTRHRKGSGGAGRFRFILPEPACLVESSSRVLGLWSLVSGRLRETEASRPAPDTVPAGLPGGSPASPVDVITITEDYGGYVAPRWVRKTVERLLSSIPDEHLTGMSAVVLADGSKRRARGRRQGRRRVAIGRYHPRWNGEPAWIELVVDRIVEDLPAPLNRLQFLRDLVVGRVLFHEVGHHLHATRRSVWRAPEPAAEEWRRRLTRIHVRQHYAYLRPILRLLSAITRALRARAPRRRTDQSAAHVQRRNRNPSSTIARL